MNPLYLYTITPLLGLIRNYIKYKQCRLSTFMRTPLLYFLIHIYLGLCGFSNVIWKTLIFERWYFFLDKSLLSLINNDYMKNKNKYIKKYGLKYKN